MAVDPAKLAIIQGLLRTGSAAVCEYLRVDWNNGANTKYYAVSAHSETSPFRNVKGYTGGQSIESRLMGKPFQKFEIYGDMRAENIPVEIDDSDGTIKTLFETYGAARCELFRYYPQVDLNTSVWWGQILPPPIYGKYTQKTQLTNGYRAKERFVPSALTPEECVFPFGGLLSTADKVLTNGCPYDKHLGGSVGNLAPSGEPYINCPKTRAACLARLGTEKYYGGTDLDAVPTVVDRPGNLAFSKGNSSSRNKAVTWMFGTKYFRGSALLIWAREPNLNHPDEGYVRSLWRVGEGRVRSITAVKIMEKAIAAQHLNTRLGERGQPPTAYQGTTANFSSRALVFARSGPLNPYSVSQSSLTLECLVVGNDQVAVWTDDETFTRDYSDDRVWCLLECYTNQKTGLGYDPERFWIDDWITTSEWTRKTVTFTNSFADGEEYEYTSRRSAFSAALEGRQAVDQFRDICRSGRISMPFQYDGKYSIVPLRAWTQDELDDAVVFADHGADMNISFSGPEPVLFERTADDKLINEITLSYEESTNYDIARAIVGDDPDQKAKASKILGDESFQVVPAQFAGFGIRHLGESVRLLHWLLRFGEFETGGTKNNCRPRFRVPFEWTLGMRRYDIFKLDLELMDIPSGPNGRNQIETATAAGTASSSGNITVTVTAAGLTGSPVAVTVAITSGDTPAVWAAKVRTALAANAAVAEMFFIRGTSDLIALRAKTRAANDATMNIAIAAGTTGITAAATSANTTAGVADGPWEYFRLQNVKRIGDNLAEIQAVAYNRYAMDEFEVESADPPTTGYCSIDADCPTGYVCRDGVCVPTGGGPICRPAIGTVTHDPETGELVIPVDPC